MPRIRTLKPEHRQHRKVGPLDHLTYRLWVGMILEADDDGRMAYDPGYLRATILPYHPKVTPRMVEASVTKLEAAGLISRYCAGGQCYLSFPSWHDHQKIDRKVSSKLPASGDSSSPRRALVEPSSLIYPDLSYPEGSYLSCRLDEGSSSPPATPSREFRAGPTNTAGMSTPTGPQAMRTAARDLLEFLNRKADKHFQPTAVNLDTITARLREGATVEQCRAIIGLKVARWKGDARMHEYLRPETLFGRRKFASYLGELPASAFGKEETVGG